MDYLHAILVIISGLLSLGNATDDDNMYCISDEFTATCKQSEVVVMETALYGRMKIGKCINRDYGYLGCKTDVLHLTDHMCSGLHHCSFTVPSKELEAQTACPEDFKSYLAATYTCLEVVTPDPGTHNCHAPQVVKIRSKSGFLSSVVTSDTGCGSTEAPWILEAEPGLRINLTLVDFAWSPYGLPHTADQKFCNKYARLSDGAIPPLDVYVCDHDKRVKHEYLSTGNAVQVEISPGEQDDAPRFLIQYEVIGCSDITPPEYGWVKRSAMEVEVGCNQSQDKWTLKCIDGKWDGDYGSCPEGKLYQESTDDPGFGGGFLPFGQDMALVIVCGTAFVIAVLILAVGIICLKRNMSHQYSDLASYQMARVDTEMESRDPNTRQVRSQWSRNSEFQRNHGNMNNQYEVIWDGQTHQHCLVNVDTGPSITRTDAKTRLTTFSGEAPHKYFELDTTPDGTKIVKEQKSDANLKRQDDIQSQTRSW